MPYEGMAKKPKFESVRQRRRKNRNYSTTARRNGFLSNTSKYLTKGYVRVTTSDKTRDYSTTEDDNVVVVYSNLSTVSNTTDNPSYQQLVPYLSIYDVFQLERVTYEYWLNDNDEIVAANTIQPTMTVLYDPDAYGRKLTAESIKRHPLAKRIFMKQGETYKVSLRPQYGLKDNAGATVLTHNVWRDNSDLTTDISSRNGYQVLFELGKQTPVTETGAINYRIHYHFAFAGRRQNSSYQIPPAL